MSGLPGRSVEIGTTPAPPASPALEAAPRLPAWPRQRLCRKHLPWELLDLTWLHPPFRVFPFLQRLLAHWPTLRPLSLSSSRSPRGAYGRAAWRAAAGLLGLGWRVVCRPGWDGNTTPTTKPRGWRKPSPRLPKHLPQQCQRHCPAGRGHRVVKSRGSTTGPPTDQQQKRF